MSSYVLVLNASYEFLNIASLERALKLIYKGKAEIIESVPGKEIASVKNRFKMPSIIRLLYLIVRPYKNIPLSKQNILLRDGFVCQYCGRHGNTVDHIIPKSRSGKDSWENCVCACIECNQKKHNRTPQEANMKLLRKPRRPSIISFIIRRLKLTNRSWEKYLS